MSDIQMGSKVVKFGGSSLADAGQFRKVRAIIESAAEICCAVCTGQAAFRRYQNH